MEPFYKRADGQPGTQLLYRNDEATLGISQGRRAWDFKADGALFRLVAEAYRIHLAHLFDPVLAVHTSLIEPLPHQITGVYGEMLPRQPLRFLLADNPGAGKTIMAGLLLKELMIRGDVRRCARFSFWSRLCRMPDSLRPRGRPAGDFTGGPFCGDWGGRAGPGRGVCALPGLPAGDAGGGGPGWASSGGWLAGGDALEGQVMAHAIEKLAPAHLERVRARREAQVDKTLAAVQERLTKEINYWDQRAAELRQQEKSGRANDRLNAARAQQRADELAARLERRREELALERQVSATPPAIIGGAVIIPLGLLLGERTPADLVDRRITEAIAMQAALQAEAGLGHHPRDVHRENLGYDIESLDPVTGRLRFIEVKGRRAGRTR